MADEAELLAAVLASPDEDAPRLDYAAWCDALTDPSWTSRGELIRLQLDGVGLDRRNPASLSNRQRIQELLDTYGSVWTQGIDAWIDGFLFLRGFVGLIRLSASNFVNHADEIHALAPVQHLDLSAVRDVDEALADSAALAKIRTLRMDGCGLHDLHLQLVADSPHAANLRWLSVADNHLTIASAEALAASPHLRDLEFAQFRSNPSDPAEQLGLDSGVVVASWMPPEGEDLEARYGYLPWLHREVPVHRFAE
ncbi:MAG: TIGR02996 domain-containing protein [Nannocystales bacterium]